LIHGSILNGVAEIPKTVKKIGTGAFYGREDLRSVVLPDSVTEIREKAFASCAN